MQQIPRQQLAVRPPVDGEEDRVGLDVPQAKLSQQFLGPGGTTPLPPQTAEEQLSND